MISSLFPRRISRIVILVLLGFFGFGSTWAQVPGEPLRVPLKFSCAKGESWETAGLARITLCGITAETAVLEQDDRSPVRTVYLEAGKLYTGWSNANAWWWAGGFFSAPPGYAIYINGKKQQVLGPLTGSAGYNFNIRVVNEATFRGAVGEATSLSGGRILWQVSAGKMRSQEYAGNLMISYDGVTKDQWDAAASPIGLYFEANVTESVTQSKIIVLKKPMSGMSVLRQIYAPQATIDIITNADDATIPVKGYKIRFFHPSQASAVSSTSVPVTFAGLPFVEYLIEDAGTWADPLVPTHLANAPELRVMKTRRSASTNAILSANPLITTTILRRTSDASNGFIWRIEDWWEGEAQKGRTVVKHIVNGAGTEDVVEAGMVTLETNQSGLADFPSGLRLATREARTYTQLGDLATSDPNQRWLALSQRRVESEDGEGSLTAATQENLLHYDNAATSEVASRGFLYGKTDGGGAWEYYDYSAANDIFSTGKVMKIFRPFLNQADPFPSDSTASNRVGPNWTHGEITEFTYSPDDQGMNTRPASKITKVNGKIVEKETRSYGYISGNGNVNLTTIRNFPNPGSSVSAEANAYIETKNVDYVNTMTSGLYTGRPYALTTATGQKTSFLYQYVNRGTAPNTFTAASNGKLVRTGKIKGTVASVPANAQTGAGSSVLVGSFGGFDLSDLHVVEGISTLEIEVYDEYCNLIRTETSVWKRSSATSGEWQLLESIDYTYNFDHTLAQRQSNSGKLHTFTVSRGRVDSEVALDGSMVTYIYDSSGRIKTSVESGLAPVGAPATPTLTTTYLYDGTDRVLSKTLSGVGTAETITASRLYDLAGRVLVETAPGGYVTLTTHSPATRQISVSAPFKPVTAPVSGAMPAILPGTLVTTLTHFADGRLQSKQMTGLPADTYTYSILPNGHRLTRMDSGSPAGGRFVETVTDGLGRIVSSSGPRPLSGGYGSPRLAGKHTKRNFYNEKGQLIRISQGLADGETSLPDGAPGLADTLYAYDAFDRPYRRGLDINANGIIDLAGPDRVFEADERLQLSGSAWWLREENFAYLNANSAERFSGGYRLTRLTGLSSALASETKLYDAEGNERRDTSVVDRTARTVTVTHTATGLTGPATNLFINGFAVRKATSDGLVYLTEYDKLGRAFKSTAPRVGATETIYLPGTPGTVQSMKDPRGVTVAAYDYDDWGRVKTAINAEGKATYTSYTSQGRVHRVWGPAAMPIEYGYDGYGTRTTLKTFQQGADWHGTSWPSNTGQASVTSWDYDLSTGLLMAKRDALTQSDNTRGYVSYEYDALGRAKVRRWGRGLASDPATRVSTTHAYYPGSGDLETKVYNDDTPDLGFSYTRSGLLKSVTDSTGTRVFAFDPAKPWRLQTEALADGYQFTELYEESGTTPLPDSVILPGRARGFRFGTVASPASISEQIIGMSGLGRLVSISSSRPAIGSLPAVTQVFRYAYRADAPLISGLAADGTGFSVSRTYEPQRDLLTGIETKWGLDVRVRHRYLRDDAGRRRHAFQDGSAFGDYVLPSGEGLRQDYDYDDLGQLKTARSSFAQVPTALGAPPESTARSVPDRQYGYAYDHAGNRTGAAFKHSGAVAPPQNAFYDAANELERRDPGPVAVRGLADSSTQVAVEDIAANAQNGQIETKAEQVEKVGSSNYWHKQLEFIPTAEEWRRYGRGVLIGVLRSGGAKQDSRFVFFQGTGATIKYDADGNLTDDDKWKYTWDAENRLVRQQSLAWLAEAGAGPRLDIHYRYDYLDRRVAKRVHTLDATDTPVAQKEHRYYYDDWNLVAEAILDENTAQSVFLRSYTWGLDAMGSLGASGGVGALLQIADHADGQRYFPAYDGNGNVSALIRAVDGSVAATYEYSPFGENLRRASNGIAVANPFRFSTKFADDETEMIYYGYRYYNPTAGRFINRDPIEERGGSNLFGFCLNDSVNTFDILGLAGVQGDTPIIELPPLVVVGERLPAVQAMGTTLYFPGQYMSVGSSAPFSHGGLVNNDGVFYVTTISGKTITGEYVWKLTSLAEELSQQIKAEMAADLAELAGGMPVVNLPSAADIKATLNSFLAGAIQGDFNKNTNVASIAGQVTVGLIPFVGQIADLRDTVAAIGAFSGGGWKTGGAYLGLGAAAIGWVPGMDWVKGLRKAGNLVESAPDIAKIIPEKLVPGGPKPFAMGIENHLDDFARQHGATTWKNFEDVTAWKPQVLDKLADPNQRVMFNLDDVDVWGGVQRAASGGKGATDWELLQIRQNPDFPNVEFWQGGQQVANPFK